MDDKGSEGTLPAGVGPRADGWEMRDRKWSHEAEFEALQFEALQLQSVEARQMDAMSWRGGNE